MQAAWGRRPPYFRNQPAADPKFRVIFDKKWHFRHFCQKVIPCAHLVAKATKWARGITFLKNGVIWGSESVKELIDARPNSLIVVVWDLGKWGKPHF